MDNFPCINCKNQCFEYFENGISDKKYYDWSLKLQECRDKKKERVTMADITKEQAIERLNNHILKMQQPYIYDEDKQAVKMAIQSLEERKQGEWKKNIIRNVYGGCMGWEQKCSSCGKSHRYDEKFNFCPNCGADMRLKDNV